MQQQVLHIKNMVCHRCIRVVKEELENSGLEVLDIKLGEVKVSGFVDEKLNHIQNVLEQNGFELIDDKKARTVEKIKIAIIELIHQDQQVLNINYSTFLEETLGLDYQYLSSLFSSTESITLEKYIILQKIERVKELLVYNELTLSEIAYQLGYSSVHHLSNQFKKTTGLSPSHFKKIKEDKRKALDKVGNK
ncbi:MAG: AraC family transcriptional regulator [Bacteroidota bacterium]|nr:AraC family transcriptional regulator [Bacteroidota bacterium]